MFDNNYNFTCVERFMKYVKVDTQSSEESTTFPSTEKQKNLGKILVEELQGIGVTNAEMDENGYVYAELSSNVDKEVPTIVFLAHMDTSPDVSGAFVSPKIHTNYQGADIVLPHGNGLVLTLSENPELNNQFGKDLITTDGSTLLGADDKAGLSEIMDAVNYLLTHPEVKHGTVKICFTPDEEVGRGTEKIDLKKINARFAYTIDGESLGEVESETFCADSVILTISGYNCHPGYANEKLVNSIKIAAEFIDSLPKNALSPETTKERQGYVHPHILNGSVESATIKLLIRDFEIEGLKEKEKFLMELIDRIISKYSKSHYKFEVIEQYRNMRFILDRFPFVVDYAKEAVIRAEIEPRMSLIRGGTDGSRLSYMNLPCPNIFAGGHNFHSRMEWISIQDMKKAVEVIVNLCEIWAEKS